jgi:ligand-binding SRPBCC domain-containing protein
MTPEALKLIAKVEAKQPRAIWRHRLHGFTVEIVNRNLFNRVLVKMPSGNMIEMGQAQFDINYSTEL